MKFIKTLFPVLSLLSFLVLLFGIEANPWYGLMILPFAFFMYLSGGCYEDFYSRREAKKPAAILQVGDGEERAQKIGELPKAC